MQKKKLLASTFLSKSNVANDILDILTKEDHHKKIVEDILSKSVVNNNQEFETNLPNIKAGKQSLSIANFSDILQSIKQSEKDLSDRTFIKADKNKNHKTPLSQKEFIDAMEQGLFDIQTLEQQLKKLREEAKKESGYLKKAFTVFTDEKPISRILNDVVKFEKYCYKNGIYFDEVETQLKAGKKPKTVLDGISDFRFLVAAGGGLAMGFAGVNVMEEIPALSHVPDAFFGALPYIAVPFISLNIFQAFSEKNLLDEAGTLLRFGGTMATGFAISLGITGLMSGTLTPQDVGTISDAALNAPTSIEAEGFRPAEYILHSIITFATFAGVYKTAKSELDKNGVETAQENLWDKTKNGAMSIIFNKYTNPAIKTAGDFTSKLASKTDKAFSGYMNYLGIPAIFIMLSNTAADSGTKDFSAFGEYYTVVLAAMGTAAVALSTASYLYGCRKDEFKAIFNTVTTAFGISSSAATMPVTKANLKKMGVSDKTASSVVPLGANFNMMGTALYLGTTAACASVIFGQELTAIKQLEIFSIVLLTAFGAPGAPASNITLLDPVLHQLDITTEQVKKMYEAVIPVDRIFDMMQTSLNVWGDMIVALGKDKYDKKKELKKANLPKI